jgi:hypothetical protein
MKGKQEDRNPMKGKQERTTSRVLTVAVMLSPELLQRLREEAQKEDRSVSYIVRRVLTRVLLNSEAKAASIPIQHV